MEVEGNCCQINNDKEIRSPEKKNMFSEVLQKSIDNIIKKEGYVSYNVNKKIISTEGGNYLGMLFEVNVKGKTECGKKETHLFIKKIVSTDLLDDFFCITNAYLTESYVYNELLKIYTNLQNEANVPQEERFKTVKSYDETNGEAIILENLAKKGYKTFYRMNIVSLKFAELSVKQLAIFHGLSFVLKDRRPEYFNKNISSLKVPFAFNDAWRQYAKKISNITIKNLKDEIKLRATEFIPTLLKKLPQYYENKTSIRCACHGDYRANNILMNEIDGEVADVIPVDYQLVYYGCPINDLLYFIFSCTDRQFRKKHMEDLKNMYYDSLNRFMQYFNIDAEFIYPRKEFERIYREKLDFGLMFALYFFPALFVPENSAPGMSKDSADGFDVKLDERIHERFQGILEDCIEWNCL